MCRINYEKFKRRFEETIVRNYYENFKNVSCKRYRNFRMISQNSRFNLENQRKTLKIFYENCEGTGTVGIISANVSENFEITTRKYGKIIKKHKVNFEKSCKKMIKIVNNRT